MHKFQCVERSLGTEKSCYNDNDRDFKDKLTITSLRIQLPKDRVSVAMLVYGRHGVELKKMKNVPSIEMIKLAFRLSFPSLLPKSAKLEK